MMVNSGAVNAVHSIAYPGSIIVVYMLHQHALTQLLRHRYASRISSAA